MGASLVSFTNRQFPPTLKHLKCELLAFFVTSTNFIY